MKKDGTFNTLSKKERLQVDRLRAKLEKNLGSIVDMSRLPAAVFVVDIMREHIAIKEAQKLNIPIFAMVDTNSDPREVEYVIPSNDDASKSIEKVVSFMSEAIVEGLSERKASKDAKEEGKEEKTPKTPRAKKAQEDVAVPAAAPEAKVAKEEVKEEVKSESKKETEEKPAPEAKAAKEEVKEEAKPESKKETEEKPASEAKVAKEEVKAEVKPESKKETEEKPASETEEKK
jgi:small subunit ribosomal protein S2